MYGESVVNANRVAVPGGLSPRVRGIPWVVMLVVVGSGSIPACTGNPPVIEPSYAAGGVYPRVYGESDGADV